MYQPPRKVPHIHEHHGEKRPDDYFWMRERDTEPVLEYLKQENRRTAEALNPVAALEKKLFLEMKSRIKEEDSSVPVFDSGFYYYSRFQAGLEYQIHCRRQGGMDAAEEIILDENAEADGQAYYAVGDAQVSPDQKILGYSVDLVGRRIYTIRFKDLASGKMLPDKIEAVTGELCWAADNKTVFYTRQDPETLRSYQLYRYELGGGKPELVYEEKDTTFNIGVETTKRGDHILLSVYKRDSSECWVLDAHNPKSQFRKFQGREDFHEFAVVDGGDRFYIQTNWEATNFRLMEAPYEATDKSQWKEVLAHDPKVFIEDVDVYQDFIVLNERENGLTQIRIVDRKTKKLRTLKFPDPAYEVGAMGLPDFQSKAVRFHYQSLVLPPSVFEEDVDSGVRTLKKQREVPGYEPHGYESKRIWAQAPDGEKVPMSLVMKKGLKLDGNNPTLLYGYGSYGLTNDVYFRSSVVSLLDRGVVFVLAHIRGGSEMGREWYEKGRLKHKMNTFTDFIACAEKLIADKFTKSERLHIMGGSAGGLLMGAVMNLRPDLFKGVVAAVPFVDVLTTMLDETLPLTTGEYREWGDPRVPEDYAYMKQYSPYDNIVAKNYPNLLVTTGYHDSQVQYWEPAKWVARLRDLKTDQNLCLLYTELDAGHSGASGRFEALKTLAKEYAFILMLEGIRE